jgi:spore coat protein JB
MNERHQWTEEHQKVYYELMKEMQTIDFVIVELNLYLDTHPHDYQAIDQFNHYVQKSKEIKDKFQSIFGSLYHFGNSYSTYPWSWAEAPWPWQV